MDLFWKVTAGILLAMVLHLAMGKQEMGILLVLAACTMAAIVAVFYLEPVLDFLWELQGFSNLQGDLLGTLIKAVGVGITAELAGLICTDAGCGSLGKSLQFLASTVILYLSVPIFRTFLDLIREILGQL